MLTATVTTTSSTPGLWGPWLLLGAIYLVRILCFAGAVYLAILAFRALRKYLASGDARKEATALRRSLGENIKSHRTQRKMTQEFVAEQLNVSRQAVSKWETGASDPSTANLIALAKLFQVDVSALLDGVE